jgi:hypothetical protein
MLAHNTFSSLDKKVFDIVYLQLRALSRFLHVGQFSERDRATPESSFSSPSVRSDSFVLFAYNHYPVLSEGGQVIGGPRFSHVDPTWNCSYGG